MQEVALRVVVVGLCCGGHKSAYGDVEAGLFAFVFDVAGALLAEVVEDFGEDVFERVVACGSDGRQVGILLGDVAEVGDIEGRSVGVAAILCGVGVVSAEPADVLLCSCDGGNQQFGGRDVFDVLRVEEVACYFVEQKLGPGDEVGYGVVEACDVVVGVAADVDEVFFEVLGCRAVGHGAYAVLLGCGELEVIDVGEGLGVASDAVDFVFAPGGGGCEVGMEDVGRPE